MTNTTTTTTTTTRSVAIKGEAERFGGLLPAALAYAARGWHVFPLRYGSKKPATPGHPADRCDHTDPRCQDGHTGWEPRATTDPDRITRAWSTHRYGIGIACGPSGLVVVDLDTPKPGTTLPPRWAQPGVVDGADVYTTLAHGHNDAADSWPNAATYTVRTPTEGIHLYYSHPTGVRLGNTASSVGPMVDTRAHGGYVVAPPTTTPAGNYRVTVDVEPAPLPDWLTTTLTPRPRTMSSSTRPTRGTTTDRAPRYVAAAHTYELRRVSHAAPGSRNQCLFNAALALGQIVGAGALTGPDVTSALLDACAGHIGAGAFTAAEAAATIASGLRRGTAEPRTLPGTAA